MYTIGVAGQLQFGKDTTADYLNKKLNELKGFEFWKRAAFAKHVKRIFMETFKKDTDYIEEWKIKKGVIPPDLDQELRVALQFIGDGFRKIKSSIWVDLLFEDTSPKIISDCRYINELKYIKDAGGFVILLVNPNKVNTDPNGSEAEIRPLVVWSIQNRSIAENNLDKAQLYYKEYNAPPEIQHVNYILFNDQSIDDLYKKIDDQLAPVIEKHFLPKE